MRGKGSFMTQGKSTKRGGLVLEHTRKKVMSKKVGRGGKKLDKERMLFLLMNREELPMDKCVN